MSRSYDGSPGCVATMAAAGIRDACGAFQDANPPMFTDTLIRMEKLRDLCLADPELGDEVKAQYVAQEVTFVLKELDELMDDYAVRGPVIRFLLRAWRLIRPQVIEIEDGIRYRPRLSTRMAMWEADRLMAKAGKNGGGGHRWTFTRRRLTGSKGRPCLYSEGRIPGRPLCATR